MVEVLKFFVIVLEGGYVFVEVEQALLAHALAEELLGFRYFAFLFFFGDSHKL